MEVKDYCLEMKNEHLTWKAKLYDMIREMEKLPGTEKEKLNADMQALNGIIDDLGARIEQLDKECPSDWGTDKTEIDNINKNMNNKYADFMKQVRNTHIGVGF
jgi:hypothetical protein